MSSLNLPALAATLAVLQVAKSDMQARHATALKVLTDDQAAEAAQLEGAIAFISGSSTAPATIDAASAGDQLTAADTAAATTAADPLSAAASTATA